MNAERDAKVEIAIAKVLLGLPIKRRMARSPKFRKLWKQKTGRPIPRWPYGV